MGARALCRTMGTQVSEKRVAFVATIEVVILVALGLLAFLWPAGSNYAVVFLIWMFDGALHQMSHMHDDTDTTHVARSAQYAIWNFLTAIGFLLDLVLSASTCSAVHDGDTSCFYGRYLTAGILLAALIVVQIIQMFQTHVWFGARNRGDKEKQPLFMSVEQTMEDIMKYANQAGTFGALVFAMGVLVLFFLLLLLVMTTIDWAGDDSMVIVVLGTGGMLVREASVHFRMHKPITTFATRMHGIVFLVAVAVAALIWQPLQIGFCDTLNCRTDLLWIQFGVLNALLLSSVLFVVFAHHAHQTHSDADVASAAGGDTPFQRQSATRSAHDTVALHFAPSRHGESARDASPAAQSATQYSATLFATLVANYMLAVAMLMLLATTVWRGPTSLVTFFLVFAIRFQTTPLVSSLYHRAGHHPESIHKMIWLAILSTVAFVFQAVEWHRICTGADLLFQCSASLFSLQTVFLVSFAIFATLSIVWSILLHRNAARAK